MNKDDFVFSLVEYCKVTKKSPKKAIFDFINKEVKQENYQMNIRGSSFVGFQANPIHFAVQQFLKVYYGSNENTIIGSAVHEAVHYAYKCKMNLVPTRFLSCTKIIAQKAKSGLENVNPDKRNSLNLKEMIRESILLFSVYYRNVIPYNNPISSEESFKLEVSRELLSNTANYGKIFFTGTHDRIYSEDELLIMSDLKTSKSRISGTVEKHPTLQKFEDELKVLQTKHLSLSKEKDKKNRLEVKLLNSATELSSDEATLEEILLTNFALANASLTKEGLTAKQTEKIQGDIADIQVIANQYEIELNDKVLDADAKNISPTRTINKITKMKSIVENLENELKEFSELDKNIEILEAEINELIQIMEPLSNEYSVQKEAADLLAAKKQYGLQLAFYALIYMILNPTKVINKLRVEVLVKTKEPYMQIFTWDFNELEIDRASEELISCVEVVEALLNGTDSSLLFRSNSYSYIGTDTNDLIDEVEEILLNDRVA